MRKRVVRRAQLIAPFGPGAMLVTPDGVSLIAAGLDHWYESETAGDNARIDLDEFLLREWRLERELGVESFRLPPDYRGVRWWQPPDQRVNLLLTVPFLRFPQWHVCPKCERLDLVPLTTREVPRCPACGQGEAPRVVRRPPAMVQVRFIAMCDRGHVQDFPWREWVHRDPTPSCQLPMKLRAGAAASLAAIRVGCECGASRTLEGITDADSPEAPAATSYLSRNLAEGNLFLCKGLRPWLGEADGEGCGRPLLGSLRGATNVYFAIVRSAIYLPRQGRGAPPELVELLEGPALKAFTGYVADLGHVPGPQILRKYKGGMLRQFTDEEISAALSFVASREGTTRPAPVEGDDEETAFRRAEFNALRDQRNETQLITSPQRKDGYQADVAGHFQRITLVPKLRETRALVGFTRVFAENDQSLEDRKKLLWRDAEANSRSWLPAAVVFGEGIYLELDDDRLREWEARPEVDERVVHMAERYRHARERRRLRERVISPRFVLIHTLAHLLMNQLTFDCGYSTASLRERLFVSTNRLMPMAGILVYTAAGDVDGTMGGLVRMGKPGYLEPVIRRALRNAQWCSSDPVCMELGARGGQGPDSCNLAACHNCGLVPETSCEEFNRFLDRGLAIGTFDRPDLGFFSAILSAKINPR